MGVHEDLTLWVDDGHGLSIVAQFDLTVLADFDLDGLPNECPLACLDAGFSQDSDDDADGEGEGKEEGEEEGVLRQKI